MAANAAFFLASKACLLGKPRLPKMCETRTKASSFGPSNGVGTQKSRSAQLALPKLLIAMTSRSTDRRLRLLALE
jgi:hypothetical protein